jgi:hypothetical protein
MATLQIRKKAEKIFVHVPSDQAEFIISKFCIGEVSVIKKPFF